MYSYEQWNIDLRRSGYLAIMGTMSLGVARCLTLPWISISSNFDFDFDFQFCFYKKISENINQGVATCLPMAALLKPLSTSRPCTFYHFSNTQTWPLLKALINFTSGREAPPKAELVSVVTVNPFVANFFLPKKQEIFAYYGFACEWESS